MRAGGDKVAFPAELRQGVLYTTVDRADNKQFRELYAPQAAIDAVKAGQADPERHGAHHGQLQGQARRRRQPEKDANGRFIKTDELAGIAVMEKRTGWGAEYADDVRNGEWEYQAFKRRQDRRTTRPT